jgi:NAD(P)-dependent dehydrogenase (short-subunit alcohol dehydrogenase family)
MRSGTRRPPRAQVVLITGCTGVIGAAIAARLRKDGDRVFVTSRTGSASGGLPAGVPDLP